MQTLITAIALGVIVASAGLSRAPGRIHPRFAIVAVAAGILSVTAVVLAAQDYVLPLAVAVLAILAFGAALVLGERSIRHAARNSAGPLLAVAITITLVVLAQMGVGDGLILGGQSALGWLFSGLALVVGATVLHDFRLSRGQETARAEPIAQAAVWWQVLTSILMFVVAWFGYAATGQDVSGVTELLMPRVVIPAVLGLVAILVALGNRKRANDPSFGVLWSTGTWRHLLLWCALSAVTVIAIGQLVEEASTRSIGEWFVVPLGIGFGYLFVNDILVNARLNSVAVTRWLLTTAILVGTAVAATFMAAAGGMYVHGGKLSFDTVWMNVGAFVIAMVLITGVTGIVGSWFRKGPLPEMEEPGLTLTVEPLAYWGLGIACAFGISWTIETGTADSVTLIGWVTAGVLATVIYRSSESHYRWQTLRVEDLPDDLPMLWMKGVTDPSIEAQRAALLRMLRRHLRVQEFLPLALLLLSFGWTALNFFLPSNS